MYIYLPIAEIPVNSLFIIVLGIISGVFSGIFGVGGGFFLTPALIFMGVPPAIAVSSSANQIIGASFSGLISHIKHKNVDYKMGLYLLLGSLLGGGIGIILFTYWTKIGQIDFFISFFYVLFLGSLSLFMLYEGLKTLKHNKQGKKYNYKFIHEWLQKKSLPNQVFFPHSNISISIYLPISIGILIGILVSLMGIGGGFIAIPAMIYVLGMSTMTALATSLFQIIFTTTFVTILHVLSTNKVDIILVFIILIGSVVGAQIGTRIVKHFNPTKLRIVLASIMLIIVLKLLLSLFLPPDNIYQITVEG